MIDSGLPGWSVTNTARVVGFAVPELWLRQSDQVKTIGRTRSKITALPGAQGLNDAVSQQSIGLAMAALHSTGIVNARYRFATPQEADAQCLDALVGGGAS
jgi:hypothetical protein